MSDKIMHFLAKETGGKSYKAHKYGLDHAERPFIDYGEDANIWESAGETTLYKDYIPLEQKSIELARRGEQLLTYFLDGSRRVYKVDDISYSIGGRNLIYPIIAGQIGVGCCKRVNRVVSPERYEPKIVLSVPQIASKDRKPGYWPSLLSKLNQLNELQRVKITIDKIIPYSVSKSNDDKYEDKGTARVQDEMVQMEKDMVAQLVKEGKLDYENFLVKDGSLEYRPPSDIIRNERQLASFRNNYGYVLGVSKNFNPEVCKNSSGKSDPGFIADLPLYSRTPVALFRNPDLFGSIEFAVWYIRIHDKSKTRTAFDGIIKVEKMLVTHEEITSKKIDSELVDTLSALLINERNPVCYGADLRWANHIYPVYLTESYVKSKYLSAESFLHLF